MPQTTSLGYVKEKTQQAIYTLAAGDRPLAERLFDAAICFGPLDPNQMPDGFPRDTYAEFLSRITAVQAAGSEGNIKATIATMDESTLRTMVDLIFKLEDELEVAGA